MTLAEEVNVHNACLPQHLLYDNSNFVGTQKREQKAAEHAGTCIVSYRLQYHTALSMENPSNSAHAHIQDTPTVMQHCVYLVYPSKQARCLIQDAHQHR